MRHPGPALWVPGLAAILALTAACAGPADDPTDGEVIEEEAGVGQGAGIRGDAAGGDPVAPGTAADTLEPGTYAFTCADGYVFAATLDRDTAKLELVLREDTLPRVPSASGAKFERGATVFRTRGAEAMLATDGTEHVECRGQAASSPWEKAALMGVAFRALGQEPGWILDIHPDRWIRHIGDYGGTRIAFPPVTPDASGDTVTYRTETEDHMLTAVLRPTPCRDAMSGRPFSHTVTVRVDGRVLEGCGRRLDAP